MNNVVRLVKKNMFSENSIINFYYKCWNIKIKVLRGVDFRMRSKYIKKMVKKNAELKNLYKNDRVFILANGPSIKNDDLSALKGEKIFTVNQMVRKPEFVELEPLCNFWFDPAYFDEKMPDESKKEFEELFIKTCCCNDKIINFVPRYAYDFLSKRKLLNERVRILDSSLYFYDSYKEEINFAVVAPAFQNIVQYAIAMAIFMGFSEIYLLGCDSTGIITKINQVMDKSIEDCYTYDLGEKGQNYVNSLLDYFSIEEQFAGWTRIFHLYKELFKYCTERGIKLINCSSQTIIEGVPRISIERVLNNERKV